MMRMQRVAGLILISTRSDAAHGARLMAEINVPTVLRGCYVEGVPFDIVTMDEVRAGTSQRNISSISAIAGSPFSPAAKAYRPPRSA